MTGGCVWIVSNQPTPYRAALLDALRSHDRELVEIYRFPRADDRRWKVDPGSRSFLRDDHPQPGLSLGLVEPIRLLRFSRSLPRPRAVVAGGYEAPLLFLTLALLARRWSVPLLLWAGTHAHSSLNQGWLARTWRWLAHHLIDGLIAYSSRAARYATGLRASLDVSVVGNAHRPLPAVSTRVEPGEYGDGVRLLYVGRLVPEKRVELLVRGAEVFSTRSGRRVEVAVAGSGPSEASIRSSGHHVAILGHLGPGELAQELDRATALALPSVFDPWGLVVNEAMEAGTPVLVDERVGCVPDLADRATAIVGRFDSATDVAAAIQQLDSLNPAKVEELRERARRRVAEFTPDAVAARIQRALEQHMERAT